MIVDLRSGVAGWQDLLLNSEVNLELWARSLRSITLVEILVLVEVLVQSRSPDGGDGAVPPSSKVVALTWARIRPTDVGT